MSSFWTTQYDKRHPEMDVLSKATLDLPYAVSHSAYALPNESGGLADFACPCCGRKVTVYHDVHLGRITVNNWGHCPHFGDNGEYPNDAIGFRMAEKGMDNTYENGMETLRSCYGELGTHGDGDWYSPEATAERTRRRSKVMEKNALELRTKALWGDDMPQEALDLLALRGLEDISRLRPSTREKIGFCRDVRLSKLKNPDETYSATGIVFRLGDDGFQIRRARKDLGSFCGDEDGPRFYTVGPSKPFNLDVLDYANALDPIFVVEGPMDAITMESALYREDTKVPKAQVVSIQGCGNHRSFAQELERRGGRMVLVLALDSDEAGVDAQLKLKDELSTNPNLTLLPFPGYMGFKDMNDMWRADRAKASWYMQTIHAIGRHVADGRLSRSDGADLLMDMSKFSPTTYRWCRERTVERFNEAVERQRRRVEQALGQESKHTILRHRVSEALDLHCKERSL